MIGRATMVAVGLWHIAVCSAVSTGSARFAAWFRSDVVGTVRDQGVPQSCKTWFGLNVVDVHVVVVTIAVTVVVEALCGRV